MKLLRKRVWPIDEIEMEDTIEVDKVDNDVLFRWIVGKVDSERKEGGKTKEEGEKWKGDKEREDEEERMNGERKGKKE